MINKEEIENKGAGLALIIKTLLFIVNRLLRRDYFLVLFLWLLL